MNPLNNPYQVLGLTENASIEQIELAFISKRASYEKLDKLSKKQMKEYDQIYEAYELLSDQTSKAQVDIDLMINNNHRSNSLIDQQSPLDSPDIEETELSRVKTIGREKQKSSNMFFYAVAVVGVLGWWYLYGDSTPKHEQIKQEAAAQAEQQRKQQEEEQKAEQLRLAQQPIPLIAPPDAIENNLRYPSPKAFIDTPLLFTQHGELFPTESSLISTLPQTHEGTSSIVVQNPHKSPIYGKLIVQFDPSMNPIVIRNFYVKPLSSFELFSTPSGKYQIQILTLDKPTAYVSPTFNIPLYSEEQVTQLANWAFAYDPNQVF